MKPKKQLRWLLVLFVIAKYVNSEYLNPQDIQSEPENNLEDKTVNRSKLESDEIRFKQAKFVEKVEKENAHNAQKNEYKVTNNWRRHTDSAAGKDVNEAQVGREVFFPRLDARSKIIVKTVTEGPKARYFDSNSQGNQSEFNMKNSIQRLTSNGGRKSMEITITARLKRNQRSRTEKNTQRMENNGSPSISKDNIIKANRITIPVMIRRTENRFTIPESEGNNAYRSQKQRRFVRKQRKAVFINPNSKWKMLAASKSEKHRDYRSLKEKNTKRMEDRAVSSRFDNNHRRERIVEIPLPDKTAERFEIFKSERNNREWRIRRPAKQEFSLRSNIRTSKIRSDQLRRDENRRIAYRTESQRFDIRHINGRIDETPLSDILYKIEQKFAISASKGNKAYGLRRKRSIDRIIKRESSLYSNIRRSKIRSNQSERNKSKGRIEYRTESQGSNIRSNKGRIDGVPISDIIYKTERKFAISESQTNKGYRLKRERRINRMEKQASSLRSNTRLSSIRSNRLQRDEDKSGNIDRRTNSQSSDIRRSQGRTVGTSQPDITYKRIETLATEKTKAFRLQREKRINRMVKQAFSLSSNNIISKVRSDRLQRDECRGKMERRTDSQKSDIRDSKWRIAKTPLPDISYREQFGISNSKKNKAYRSQRERRTDKMEKQASYLTSNIRSGRFQRDESRDRMQLRTDSQRLNIRQSKGRIFRTPVSDVIAKVFVIYVPERNMASSHKKENSMKEREHKVISSRSNIRQRISENIGILRRGFRCNSAEKFGISVLNANAEYRKQKEIKLDKRKTRITLLRSDLRRKSITVDTLGSKKYVSYKLQIERETGKMERFADSLKSNFRTREIVAVSISEENKACKSLKFRNINRIERKHRTLPRSFVKERVSEMISKIRKNRLQKNIGIAESNVDFVTSVIKRDKNHRSTRSQRDVPNKLQKSRTPQKFEFRNISPKSEKSTTYKSQKERIDRKLKSSFYGRSYVRCKPTERHSTFILKTSRINRLRNERKSYQLENSALYSGSNKKERSEIVDITRINKIVAHRSRKERNFIGRTESRSFSQKYKNERKTLHRFAGPKSEKIKYYRILKGENIDRRRNKMSSTSDLRQESNIIITFRSERSNNQKLQRKSTTSTIRSRTIILTKDVRHRDSKEVPLSKLERNYSYRLQKRSSDRVVNKATSTPVSKNAILEPLKHYESKPRCESNTVIVKNVEACRNLNARKVRTINGVEIAETHAGRHLQKVANANILTISLHPQNMRSLERTTISKRERNTDHRNLVVRKRIKLSSTSNIRIRKQKKLLNSRSEKKINMKFQKLRINTMNMRHDISFPTKYFIKRRISEKMEAKNELSQLIGLNERIVLSKKEVCQDCWNSSIFEKQIFMTSIIKETPVVLTVEIDIGKYNLNAGSVITSWTIDSTYILHKVNAIKTRNVERLYMRRPQTKPLLKDSLLQASHKETSNRIYERVAEKLRLQNYYSTKEQTTADVQRNTIVQKSERRITLKRNQNQKLSVKNAEVSSWFTVLRRNELRIPKNNMQFHKRNGRGFRGRRDIFKLSTYRVRAQSSRMNEKSDHVHKNEIYFTTQFPFDNKLKQGILTHKIYIWNQIQHIFDAKQLKLSNHRENTRRRLNSALKTISARRLTEKHEYKSSLRVDTPSENYAAPKESLKLREKNMLPSILNLTLSLLILMFVLEEKTTGKSKSLTEILHNGLLLRTNVF